MESDPAKLTIEDTSPDAIDIDIETFHGAKFGTFTKRFIIPLTSKNDHNNIFLKKPKLLVLLWAVTAFYYNYPLLSSLLTSYVFSANGRLGHGIIRDRASVETQEQLLGHDFYNGAKLRCTDLL